MSLPTIDPVSSRYGAPLGRAPWLLPPAGPVRVFRLPLDSGGYDRGGAYWGHGEAIYCATDGHTFRAFSRAPSRAEAVARIERSTGYTLPLARRAVAP